jgi:hypothetical protein
MGYREQLAAMNAVGEVLENLDGGERVRVLRWAIETFGVEGVGAGREDREPARQSPQSSRSPQTTSDSFSSLGELLDAANPDTTYDRILVICYWLQELQGQDDFVAQGVNEELKHQGHSVANITDAFTKLMRKVPAPVRQTRKEGTSAQARKRYALTEAGKRSVLNMLRRTDAPVE